MGFFFRHFWEILKLGYATCAFNDCKFSFTIMNIQYPPHRMRGLAIDFFLKMRKQTVFTKWNARPRNTLSDAVANFNYCAASQFKIDSYENAPYTEGGFTRAIGSKIQFTYGCIARPCINAEAVICKR